MSTITYQPLLSQIDPEIRASKTKASVALNFIRDQFSIATWAAGGAIAQVALLSTFKTSYAVIPILAYTVYTIVYLIYSTFAPAQANPFVTYHKTTALVPAAEDGQLRAGSDGEKLAVLHLGFKNYSPLGASAAGYKAITTYAQEMMEELHSNDGRRKYGFLGGEPFLEASSPSGTSSSMVMLIMYFRSIDGVHAYAQSDLHRKAWVWYDNFIKGSGVEGKHLGIMHEVLEAPASKWETVYNNMERVGFARAQALTGDDELVSTVVDASKGKLSKAKGRVS